MAAAVTRITFDDLPEEVQEALALVEFEEGDPTPVFERVAREYPGFVPARLNLAMFRLDQGDITAAQRAYEEIARQFPEDLGAVAGLATVYWEQGQQSRAVEFASRALAGGYDWPTCYEILGQANEAEGKVEEAAEIYLNGYRKSPHSWTLLEDYCRLKKRSYTPPSEEVEAVITLEQLNDLAWHVDEAATSPDSTGEEPGCDHSFRFAEAWAAKNQVDVIELYQFLNAHGGFCDCEICFNVTELLGDEDDFED